MSLALPAVAPIAAGAVAEHAAALTNLADIPFNDNDHPRGDQWTVDAQSVSVTRSGTDRNQSFSGTIFAGGGDSIGLLRSTAQVNDTSASEGPLDAAGKITFVTEAHWEDVIRVSGLNGSTEDLQVVVGVSGSLSADAELSQPSEPRIYFQGGEPGGFDSIADITAGPVTRANVTALADPSTSFSWDGDLFIDGFTTAQEAGWETFSSNISYNEAAQSFSAAIDGQIAFDLPYASLDGDDTLYEVHLSLGTLASTSMGEVISDAGSSLDFVGLRRADGTPIDVTDYSFDSGMTVIPEPTVIGWLVPLLAGVIVLTRHRRSRSRP